MADYARQRCTRADCSFCSRMSRLTYRGAVALAYRRLDPCLPPAEICHCACAVDLSGGFICPVVTKRTKPANAGLCKGFTLHGVTDIRAPGQNSQNCLVAFIVPLLCS
eukprot:GHVR01021989.1.p3 GENE.GHVR01021989.1~~GHVR01021989.1.p3  ORF type:complete len:108 (+),score=6.00 GHVR01021989.1:341-664(+)